MAAREPVIGYIGLGLMGMPMVLRLLAAGYAVNVWGRTRAKLAPALDEGAVAHDSPAALARASDIVLLCVSDTAAVEAVVYGEDGVAAGAAADKLLVDLSSIRPDAAARMAARLREHSGMGWIDAPVSGGVVGAETGNLVVMAGGAREDFDRALPVLRHLAKRVTLMGANGAGQSTKLVNQLIVGCTVAVISEATRFAVDCGVDAARIPEALAGGRADSLPLQQWMPKMAARDFTVESYMRTMLKDLDTVLDVARGNATALPLTALGTEIHRLLVGQGLGEADGTAIHRLYDLYQGRE
ncbi:MAG: NAD(P)-dependent oxidoreductase [Gammaproteobacteria bacterium]|nr:NAD(P)-dependent oxidoreductase [Gammaproteobacteria bacterium]